MSEKEPPEQGAEAVEAVNVMELPLMEDVFLSMQARNLLLVDAYLRDLEQGFAAEWAQGERLPLPTAMLVSAMAQMWVFAAYELLRTWRQWVRALVDHGRRLEEAASPDEREAERARVRKPLPRRPSPSFYEHSIDLVEANPQMAAELQHAEQRVAPVFRVLESLRVTLAKHEVPKGKSVPASAPGYTRFDRVSGTPMWIVDEADDSRFMVSRQGLAELLGAPAGEHGDED